MLSITLAGQPYEPLQQRPMHFWDVDRCRYFARQLAWNHYYYWRDNYNSDVKARCLPVVVTEQQIKAGSVSVY